MKILEEKILSEGIAVNEDILKVDSFVNHQVDPVLMHQIGEAFAAHYKDCGVTKVVTIENNEWKISIVSSQNATNNPKLERGVIIISDEIHDFDKQIIDNEFRKHEVRNDRATGGTILHPQRDRHHTGS